MPLRAADGYGVHGPQPLHVAVLRVEAPRRVRRRSEGARVLHRLHAPVGEVLVVLELVGVVLQDPELRGRLLLHVLGRAVHRLVGPRVVGPCRPLEVVAPLPALARHPRGQVLLQRLDAPVHHGNGVAVLGPLRPVHGLRGQLPVQRGELVAQVCRDHKVLVVPRQLLCGALGGAAHRLGVLVLQRFHGGLPGQAVLRLPPRVLAEVDEVGLQPVVRPLGGRLAQRAGPGRLHLPAHVGLQRLEGHGLRHVEVALPCESVQLPRVPHVEVVGQVPQRLHLALPQKRGLSKVPRMRGGLPTCCPKKELEQGSADARRPAHTYLLPQKGACSHSFFTCSSAPAAPARLQVRPAGPGNPCTTPKARW